MRIEEITPMFVVRDLKETITFYRDVIGMEVRGAFPEDGDPTWCNMQLDDAYLMFTFEPPHTHDDGEVHESEPAFAGAIYFRTDDVDAMYTRIKERVAVEHPPGNTPWGMREFGLIDPNGFYLTFGQDVGGDDQN